MGSTARRLVRLLTTRNWTTTSEETLMMSKAATRSVFQDRKGRVSKDCFGEEVVFPPIYLYFKNNIYMNGRYKLQT